MTNLPTVYIETEANQAITSRHNYVRATLRYVDADGEKYYDALGIRGRGNSTWGLTKKPYRIRFDKKQELLGPDRAKAKSWTLLANYADKSLMRNALASCVGTFAGQPFTAAAQFVDLVLNGVYIGNYQISDQINVRPGRVDIFEQEDPITDDSDINGGYLLEVDGFASGEPCWFKTNRGVKITIKSPDSDIIDRRQIEYISSYIQDFENAIFSDNFTDPDTGYRRYVDESTLISWYIASEMTANPDAFWSTYIYKDRDDPKIYWGPLWDYDIAFNNSRRAGDMTRRTVLYDGFGVELTAVWMRRIWEDPWFISAVNEKWKSMVNAGLEKHLLEFIDNTEAELEISQEYNDMLWPVDHGVYDEYCLFSTYSATVEFLRKFVRERISFLTELLESEAGNTPTPIEPIEPFEADKNYYYLICNANTLKYADLTEEGTAVCGNTYAEGKHTQQWSFSPTGEGYFTIINRASGKAITDMAPQVNGKYERSKQLGIAYPDDHDTRQHWQPVPMPDGDTYVMTNRATGLAWNNSGGSANDGVSFISWDNDANNPNKPNRHWHIIRDEIKEGVGINKIGADEYAVTYSPSTATLRFVNAGSTPLRGTFAICSTTGSISLTGSVAETIDVSALTPGIYILTWEIDNCRITRKFVKV